MTWKPDLTIHL